MNKLKVGIIREGKLPHDKRTPFTPAQCKQIEAQFPNVELVIQPCEYRCYSDSEYRTEGIQLKEDVSDCNTLMGIKEVPPEQLIPNKKYLFFSHTIKKQAHNHNLLRAIIEKKISLIDYECLTDEEHNRVIGFGRFAGVIGAYNGINAYGIRYGLFQLRQAYEFDKLYDVENELSKVKLPNIKIIITGGGRVANGAIETMGILKIRKVTPYEFLNYSFREPVYVNLHSMDYYKPKDGGPWVHGQFYTNPEDFDCTFIRYAPVCDMLIHCAFWNPKAAPLFSKEEMKSPAFHVSVIADVTCDLNGSIPSTTQSSTIEEPFYGYDPITESIDEPFARNTITVMAVDNLPCELPREASDDFGKNLIERVLPSLFVEDKKGLIDRATIVRDGMLTTRFGFLGDYVGANPNN